ncbi:hypothetical protein B4U79_18853, partial [Dinothrombium tinctorium]
MLGLLGIKKFHNNDNVNEGSFANLSGIALMRIDRFKTENQGIYLCNVIDDDNNNISCKFIARIVIPPNFMHSFTSSGEICVLRKQKVIFSCQAKGIPQPTISWYSQEINKNESEKNLTSL